MNLIFKRKKKALVALASVMLIGSAVYYFSRLSKSESFSPILVKTQSVMEQNIPLSITSLGSLIALESAVLSAEHPGIFSKIYFKNGQKVNEGDLLIQLDDAAGRAIFNKDNAALVEAKALYNRYEQLNKIDPSVLSKVQMDTVFATYQKAKATLEGDDNNLAEMQIRAPFNGSLGATTLSIGSYLNEGDQIVTIINSNDLEVAYPVEEANYGLVALGQKVSLVTDAYPNKVFQGTVVYQDPSVDPNSRSFTVRARVDDPQGLAPGMLMHITQILIPERKILAVPTVALVSEMSGFSVYQVKNKHVIETYVQIGTQFGDLTEIKSGLSSGESIIIQGNEKVQPGVAVEIELPH